MAFLIRRCVAIAYVKHFLSLLWNSVNRHGASTLVTGKKMIFAMFRKFKQLCVLACRKTKKRTKKQTNIQVYNERDLRLEISRLPLNTSRFHISVGKTMHWDLGGLVSESTIFVFFSLRKAIDLFSLGDLGGLFSHCKPRDIL